MEASAAKITLRGRIVGMRDQGASMSAIARELGVTRITVRKWCNRWEEAGDLQDQRRCGGPRKTYAADDQRIMNEVRRNPLTTAVAVRDALRLDVSTETVRRRLHESGVHHRTPALKGKLEERHRLARLEFAQRYAQEGLEFWGRVIFSDEKTFLSNTHGRLHCWRQNNTRYDRQNIYEEAKSGRVTCNIWGWVHLFGIGELADIDGRFTAEKYIEILEEVMLPTVRAMALPEEQMIFMHVSIFKQK